MSVGEVVVERVRGAWVFTLRGEHDISSEPSLQRRLEHAFDAGSTVIVDLSEVEFMDSSVLRALAYGGAQAARHPQHHIGIVAPPDSQPRRLLALTGIDKHVSISNTRDDALAAPSPD
jgi:anti-anti-sigma factor